MTREEQIAVIERMGGVWQEIAADLRRLAALEQENAGLVAARNALDYRIDSVWKPEVERLRAALERIGWLAPLDPNWTGFPEPADDPDDRDLVNLALTFAREALEPPVEGGE